MRFATLHFPHQLALVLFLVLLVAFLAGCTKPPQPKTQASMGSSESRSIERAKSGGSDADLTAKVKNALATDAQLKAAQIDVDANSGVVILKGQVESDTEKKRLQELAQAVPGVTWVQNRVSVAPRPG
jgi:osmotically-inducible protein OsmY